MTQPKIKFFTYLNETKQIVKKILSKNPDFIQTESGFDFVVVLGGDGSFVSALNQFKFDNVKIILINVGHLGFLSNEFEDYHIDLSKLKFTKYPLLDINDGNEHYYAINEVIVGSNNTSTNVDVSINNEYLYSYFGTGFSVNTSIGSTGYIRGMNGPMLKSKNLYCFAELAPSLYANRKSLLQNLVLDQSDKLQIKLDTNQSKFIKIDGQNHELSSNEFNISLINSTAEVVDLFDNSVWVKRIKRTIIGE